MKAFKIMTYEERKEFMAILLLEKGEQMTSWYLKKRSNSGVLVMDAFLWPPGSASKWSAIDWRIRGRL